MFDFQPSLAQAVWIASFVDHRNRNEMPAHASRPELTQGVVSSLFQVFLGATRRLAIRPRPNREGATGCCSAPACC